MKPPCGVGGTMGRWRGDPATYLPGFSQRTWEGEPSLRSLLGLCQRCHRWGSPTVAFLSTRRLVESGVAGADEPPERGSSLLNDPRHGVTRRRGRSPTPWGLAGSNPRKSRTGQRHPVDHEAGCPPRETTPRRLPRG